jgi:hypothetical protein
VPGEHARRERHVFEIGGLEERREEVPAGLRLVLLVAAEAPLEEEYGRDAHDDEERRQHDDDELTVHAVPPVRQAPRRRGALGAVTLPRVSSPVRYIRAAHRSEPCQSVLGSPGTRRKRLKGPG